MTPAPEFQDRVFHDEGAARRALEALRWPDGPVCPHCGNDSGARIARIAARSGRPGLYYCRPCQNQFTVTVGTMFEHTKVPLAKWWMAAQMFDAGRSAAGGRKSGVPDGSGFRTVSARDIQRNVGVSYRTAWFMMHRLREAMIELLFAPIDGSGGPAAADRKYGRRAAAGRNRRRQTPAHLRREAL